MKNFKVQILLLLLVAFNISNAQVSENKKKYLPIDKTTNCQLRYHYFPNMEVYFDNLENIYHYKIKGNWITSSELPENYGGYSLYKNVRVMITDFDDENPFQLFKTHKKIYPYSANGKIKKITATAE